ncbi:MAG: hypothetical protein L7S64_10670 [Longimicrobiales bacterium]|nr:hypothetical protein [Longimicrobiales bacterium]
MSDPPETRWPEATALAERLVGQTAGSVRAVLMYGSRLLKTNPDRHSALDFVVIVDDYRSFYEGLAEVGELGRPVLLMRALSRVLAPNVIAYVPDDGAHGIAKCLVISADDFERALGPDLPDHFLLGRMIQRIGVVWATDEAQESWVRLVIAGAHGRLLDWMAPYLDGPFDASALGRRILEVCYQGELRPESRGRAGKIFEAQAQHFAHALAPGLEAASASGTLRVTDDAHYELASPVPPAVCRRWRRHFRRSKARATLRWSKHTLTFANWLPYIVRKVERHTGRTIQLTVLEEKLPLIFLWPRVVHVLLTRPRRELKP